MARDDTRDDVNERLDELTRETGGGKARKAGADRVAEDFAATPVGRGDASRSGPRSAAASATDETAATKAGRSSGRSTAAKSGSTAKSSGSGPKGGSTAKGTAGGTTRAGGAAKRATSGSAAGAGSSGAGSAGDEGDVEASERALDEGWSDLVESGEGPSTGLLSFYDRLRARILAAVERRGGKLGPATVRALLLVPDVFILLVRLSFDREVPASARAMIGGALAYFILPMDLFPEAMFGAAGYVDDLVLATAVLAHAFGGELEPYARKHWSGPEDVRKVLADVSGAAQGLLGENLYERLRGLLKRRGIEIDSPRR